MMKPTVYERGMGTFIDIGIIQADGLRLVQRDIHQFSCQRRVYIGQGFTGKTDGGRLSEHFMCRRIDRQDHIIQIQHDNAHRRSIDQQIEEMVLLPQMQTLVLKLLHHLIEDVDNTVGLFLPYPAQAGTEVLLLQKLHTVSDNIQRFDDTAVEKDQIKNRNEHQSLHDKKHDGGVIVEYVIGHHPHHGQQQPGQYPEQSFYPHPSVIYLSVGISYFSKRRYRAARLIPSAEATCDRLPLCVSSA